MMMVRRLIQLVLGLSLYGAAMGLMVRAGLGLDPWDVFHQGLAGRVGLSIGLLVNIVGALVLLLWIPLRQKPGIGTIANVLIIGTAMDLSMMVLPELSGLPLRGGALVLAIVVNGIAGAMYIGAGLGPGPRDGLMTGLARRTGRSIRLVRTGIELSVLAIGWLLGGTVGVGTVIYAFAIGPLVQAFLPLFTITAAKTPETLVVNP
ncbi:MAG: hypothetical protein KKE02_12860 [Alphaproteobacteria bacterium]|nr:hypothetical protein [Alphaproteobacteria bacterium]MBU1516251.1 hypothetical protein [Alphaproteobacteria bacterium]MBU2095788.1 hypothetical protein [Alphaproteobacteria bacterium]MBU2151904.1 hypothetical protein [Alphaproteobacteria bacterium]MBU2306813.1 hypothetical protein [Alphaproteobacteria bacterium]